LNNVKQEQTHLAKLAASHPDKRFCKLYRLICHPEWLMKALDAIRPNKGFNTPGTDGVRGEELDQTRIEQLAEKLRTGTYQPTPVRRVYIPKRSGKLRPLGLPMVRSYCPPYGKRSGLPYHRGSDAPTQGRSTVPHSANLYRISVVSNGVALACAGR
jgi:hypothetical protein